MDKLIGKKLDGLYELHEQIGAGGMANVYRAIDLRTQQTVAVKILKEEFINDQELVRRFKNESKAISILNHDNIVKVYDVSVSDKLQYIVMEHIDGITLKQYLNERGGKITWRETIHFIGQILGALRHAHENGVVHRDVKPQNIMMLPSGQLKMMDFGIARIARAENQLIAGKAMGSVHYISPEQAKNDLTDAKSDIYSVGVMMYEMLSGRLPFESDNVVEVAIKQISDKPTPLAQVAPDVPHALVEITEHAMAKQPQERYANVAEMQADIEKFKQDPDISFAYKYMDDEDPEKVIGKVMKQTKNHTAQNGKAKAQTGKASKKKKKFPFLPVLFGVTVAFCIGCVVLCLQIMKNSNNPLFSEKVDVILTDYTGMTRSEVEADPTSSDVTIEWVEEYSSNHAEGYVYKQSPAGGRTVKQGQTITLTVSLGTKYIELDNYAHMAQDAAATALKDLGLNVLVVQNVDQSVAVGTVIRTEPAAGQQVESGSTVYLYVSRQQVATTTKAPGIEGLSLEDARKLLSSYKLVMGSVTAEYSDAVPVDVIISQSVKEGEEININGRVSVVVSMGPEPLVEVPKVVGRNEQNGKNDLANAGLGATVVYEYSTAKQGNIIKQSIPAGEAVLKGTVVEITVSAGLDPTWATPTPAPTPVPAPTEAPPPVDSGANGG